MRNRRQSSTSLQLWKMPGAKRALTACRTRRPDRLRSDVSGDFHAQFVTVVDGTPVLRKVDLHLITPLFVLFVFNILDRSNIANAKLGGLKEDLGLTDTQYQTAVAVMVRGSKMAAGTHTLNVPVCWLPRWPDSVQYRAHSPEAFVLSAGCDIHLGWHLSVLCCTKELHRHPDCTRLSWTGRKPILSWSTVGAVPPSVRQQQANFEPD